MSIFHDLLFFSLCVGVFSFKSNNHYDFRTSEALIFGNYKKDYETIIINDDSKQLSLTWLQQLHKQFHSIILYKQRLRYHKNSFNVKRVDAILITTSSSIRLERVLDNFHKTVWWNVMVPVYILNLPDNTCEIAMEILQKMWENKILTSYFLCIKNDEVQIYTYNPFTSRAPSDWTEVQRSLIEPMQPQWTLYQRTYHPRTIWQGLDFDRTQYLDGYEMVVFVPISIGKERKRMNEYTNEIYPSRYNFIMETLPIALNVSVSYYPIITKNIEQKNSTLKTIIYDYRGGIPANLILTELYSHSKKNLENKSFTQTYPLAWYVNGIATRNHGHRTLGEKVWDFYGIWTILFTIFVLLVTFTVIYFSESRKIAFAVFEIIRLLISQSLYTRMNTLSLRIFFITILIYFLIIQATFNGHLAKFLTKPELRKHPETQEDFTDLGYTSIYNSTHFKKFIAEYANQRYKTFKQAEYCLNNFLRKDTSACVFDHWILLKLLNQSRQKEKLYVSQKPIEVQYTRYPISKHWPLLNRVNWFFVLLEELGFRQWLSKNDLKNYLKNYRMMAEARSNGDFQPIKPENLMFSFWILAVGFISATFSFCVEILMKDIKNVKRKTLKIMNSINYSCKFRR